MKGVKAILVMLMVALSLFSFQVFAGQDHSELIKGPFKDGPDVTRACLECHEEQAADFMKTSHWRWQGPINGHVRGYEHSRVEYGKTNMINGFCVNVEGGPGQLNRGHCGECHPGYFWKDDKFDLTDNTKVDCLVCHAQKGDYGREDSEISEFSDLTKAARSVARPTLKNCGACHYAGGGDDGVKHGSLDSGINAAARTLDVHMAGKAKGGPGFTCQTCHVTSKHRISGASTQMATAEGRVNCEDCHSGKNAPHLKARNGVIINVHLKTVACQTCHIPAYGSGKPTLTSWDYSTVGKGLKTPPMAGKATFSDGRGSFAWDRNVRPVYRWYDGTINRYMKGDRIRDMKAPVVLESPYGAIQLKGSKIYPFKEYKSIQPADSAFSYLLTFSNYKGLWEHKNWTRALEDGAKGSGLPFSGKYQFVETVSYIGQTHEVVPKENALTCGDCHLGGGRMNWKELGYKGDPIMLGSGRFKDGAITSGFKPANLNFIQENWVEKHPAVLVQTPKGDGTKKK
jgi:octaheme c-type cytochrome (tetrathionate reductase family)